MDFASMGLYLPLPEDITMESQPNPPGDIINQQGDFVIGINEGTAVIQPQPEKKQPPNNSPGNLANNFIGREKDLAKLHENIQTANQVAISAVAGMGGVGKSELAKQYISKHQKTYPGGICWLNATEDNFISQLIAFSGVEVNEKLTLVNQVQDCYTNWYWQGNVLLVFDDVQNYRHIKPYLPNEARFKVLITTRKRFGYPVVRLDLDVLEPGKALELLASFLDEDRIAAERETAQELCAWLGYLPLGLELVGRYLAKHKISLATMLERLKNKSLEHKSIKDAPEESNAERGVKAAFELSWEALQEKSLAKITAYFLSLFALAPIPQELLAMPVSEEDWENVEDALVELADLHLVKSLPEEAYLLHSLIREFLHTKEAQFDASQLKKVVCKVIVAKGEEIPHNITVDQVTTLSAFIPHLREVANHIPNYLADEDLTKPFTGLERFYQGQGLYNLAESWLVQGKEIVLTRLGKNNADTALILNNLANLYHLQGRYEQAEPLFLQAIEILKITLPDNHPSFATQLNNLAELYRSQGRYEEAEPLYLQAIEIDKNALPDNPQELANHLNNLANLYSDQGRYEEAEPLYSQAIEIDKNTLPDNHPYLAYSLNNLAHLYNLQGRYEQAESLYLQAIEIDKNALIPTHPILANHLNNLASLYSKQGRYEEAEPLYLQTIEIDKISLSPDHPTFATHLNNLAGLYNLQGRYEEAETLFLQGLEIIKIALPPNHPSLARDLNNLAELYRSQGRYEEAEPLYLQAIEIVKIALPDHHPYLASSLNNLAELYRSQGRYDEAEPLYLKALEIFLNSVGESHPHTQKVHKNFDDFIIQVVKEGREKELSNHPLVQNLIADIKNN